jgi:hypothetical protein
LTASASPFAEPDQELDGCIYGAIFNATQQSNGDFYIPYLGGTSCSFYAYQEGVTGLYRNDAQGEDEVGGAPACGPVYNDSCLSASEVDDVPAGLYTAAYYATTFAPGTIWVPSGVASSEPIQCRGYGTDVIQCIVTYETSVP